MEVRASVSIGSVAYARELRCHRDRGWPGRLRRRDPRRPTGPEDRRRRARQSRRPLPQLRLHPGEDDPSLGRDLSTRRENGAELGIVGERPDRLARAAGAAARKVSDSLSSGVEFLWDKDKITKIEGEGSLTADGNVSVGGEIYEAKAVIARDRLGGAADPGRRVRRPRRRHLGRLVVPRAAAQDRRRRRRRLGARRSPPPTRASAPR